MVTKKNYNPKAPKNLFSVAEDSKALAAHNGASADGAFKPGDECVSFCKEKRRLRALDRSPSFLPTYFICYTFHMQAQLNTLQINKLCQQNGISYLGLFGSYARGDFTPTSDVDLLVEYKTTPSLLEEGRIINQFQDLFKRDIDLVSRKHIKERIKPYILKDLQVLYEER